MANEQSIEISHPALARELAQGARAGGRARLLRRLPFTSLLILALMLVVGLAAPLLAPYAPNEQSLIDRLHPPFWQTGGSTAHLLGTDALGRDELSRLIYGTRLALIVVATTVVGGAILGTFLGLVAGYFGRWIDLIVMRLVDMQLAMPALLFGVLL